ncbi:hypothetical protein Nepgr_014173 [Nepenthes gracilis]|uniref:Uncharacterized protein n=1 Tax=Nepenthes gracilis TaxID=150966 RepID=A0AAD3SKJ4_NEPGR|nr:hypothetical protein Nepgr_014173 [Nepenthes gracilis]
MLPTTLLLPIVLLLHARTISITPCDASAGLPKFSAILVFGDSVVDSGNNNYYTPVWAINRADHPPYGRGFPGQIPTGRFSNGKLVPDFLASSLGIKETVPPFLDQNLSDKDIKTGVSFASGGSGYDNLTAVKTGAIPMLNQVEYFKKYIERLKGIVGEKEAKEIIKTALVVISAGSNDFIINFYDSPLRGTQFNISEYQDFIIQRFQSFVKELLEFGCKTVIVSGIPPIGCLPLRIAAKFKIHRTCLDDENSDAQSYNQKLEKLLPQLQASVQGSRLIYFDVFDPLLDMITHRERYGFVETNRGCCGTGFFEAGSLCNLLTPACSNASEFVFWDSVHPTESTYKYIHDCLLKLIFSKLMTH